MVRSMVSTFMSFQMPMTVYDDTWTCIWRHARVSSQLIGLASTCNTKGSRTFAAPPRRDAWDARDEVRLAHDDRATAS